MPGGAAVVDRGGESAGRQGIDLPASAGLAERREARDRSECVVNCVVESRKGSGIVWCLGRWGSKGTARAGEAVWSREEGSLRWTLQSADALREAERRSPKIKLQCYATRADLEPSHEHSEALGGAVLDLHELRRQGSAPAWAKLKGPGAPAELLFVAR